MTELIGTILIITAFTVFMLSRFWQEVNADYHRPVITDDDDPQTARSDGS